MALDPLTAGFELGSKLIDHFFPNAEKKAEAYLKLEELKQNGDFAVMVGQAKINEIEAGNANLFVSGWRPACGWVCAIGLLVQFLVNPLATWGANLLGMAVLMSATVFATISPTLGQQFEQLISVSVILCLLGVWLGFLAGEALNKGI